MSYFSAVCLTSVLPLFGSLLLVCFWPQDHLPLNDSEYWNNFGWYSQLFFTLNPKSILSMFLVIFIIFKIMVWKGSAVCFLI